MKERTMVAERRAEQVAGIELGSMLGEGGMAAVYEGLDQGFAPPRQVAVKFMGAELSQNAEFRARFEREASLVGNFRHDNIIRVYTCGETAAGTKYIVMEYLPSGTLAQRMESGPLPLAEALRIAVALAEALAYAHAKGVVHRDFKPANVLFTAEGNPVLTDFGVAKTESAAENRLTKYSMYIGSAHYMAPEQARCEDVTDRADVFSLGMTMVEMLAGSALLKDQSWLQRGSDARQMRRLLPPETPPALVDTIARCLQFDWKQRPAAQVVRDELREVQAQVHRPASRPQRLLWIAGASLAVVIALGAWLLTRSASEDANMAAAPAGETTPPVLRIERRPASVVLTRNGATLVGDSTTLPAGAQRIIATAPGHYGKVLSVTLAAGQTTRLDTDLQPYRLPSGAEHARFIDLAEAAKLPETDIAAAGELTLQQALRVKSLQLAGKTSEAGALEQDIADLAARGDARAAVSAMLVASVRSGSYDSKQVTPALRAASQGGDAMASFFMAEVARGELADNVDPASQPYREYCRLLRLASRQGWGAVADPLATRDQCPAGR